MTNQTIEIPESKSPAILFILIALLIIAGTGLAAGWSAQDLAKADATRAQIPNQVSAQATAQEFNSQYQAAILPSQIETAQTAQTILTRALSTGFALIVALLGVNAIYHINQRRTDTQRTAADLKLYQTQRQQESENPVHTPAGIGLTQYTQNGITYTFSQFAGITARTDDPRGMQVLAERHAPIAQQFLTAAITAKAQIEIERARSARRPSPAIPAPSPLPQLDEWIDL